MKQYGLIINGEVVHSDNTFDVINPATAQPWATCVLGNIENLDNAVKSARVAFNSWSNLPDSDRIHMLNKIISVIEENMSELMELVTKETGKPIQGLNQIGSGMEVGASLAWTAATLSLPLPVDVIEDSENSYIEVHRKPLGVVASITPWNWPLMIAIWHVIPALRAGNTVVIKPSPLTPISTIRFVELVNTILPRGVLNVVTGDEKVGNAISSHPDIQKVVFTGSTHTGRQVMKSASSTLKRLTLELGGNDAGIVLPDVNIEKIIPKLFSAAFHNNGQTCACLKRLYVHDSIYDTVSQKLSKYAQSVIVGNGLKPETQLGPLQNEAQLKKVMELVDDAIEKGANLLSGGKRLDCDGYFYEPTILSNVFDGMRIVDEEQFGPALPIIRYQDINEVIQVSNNNEFGLGASVWSDDIVQAQAIAKKIESGSVWINDHGAIQPNTPFGGIKQSGIGVGFGHYGLDEFVSLQTIKVCKV